MEKTNESNWDKDESAIIVGASLSVLMTGIMPGTQIKRRWNIKKRGGFAPLGTGFDYPNFRGKVKYNFMVGE